MKRLVILSALVFCVSVLSANTKLLLIGDSVTKGVQSANGLGFRDELYDSLNAIGYEFTFVGNSGTAPYQGHFYPGMSIGAFYQGPGGSGLFDVGPVMDQVQPNVIFLHVGTNDLISGDDISPFRQTGETEFDTETVGGRMAYLLYYLLQWKNGARGTSLQKIFVCKIIPRIDINPYKAVAFNYELTSIYNNSNGNRISQIPKGSLELVDQFTSFTTATMMSADGIHPNDLGYANIAKTYMATFRWYPLFLDKISGDQQFGKPNTALPDPLVIQIRNGWGMPKQDFSMTFNVISGDATLIQSPVLTDSDGKASAYVQLGSEETSQITVSYAQTINKTITFTVFASDKVQVDGHIQYYTSASGPVKGAQVAQISSKSTLDTTDDSGHYALKAPVDENIVIKPVRESGMTAARNTLISYDAALIARNIVELETLSSNQQTAADVNGDGKISMLDAFQVARFVSGFNPPTGSKLGQWRFTPDSVSIAGIGQNISGQDFSAILIGDVHGGYDASQISKPVVETDDYFRVLPAKISQDRLEIPVEIISSRLLAFDLSVKPESDRIRFITGEFSGTLQNHMKNIRCDSDGTVWIGCFGARPASSDTSTLSLFFDCPDEADNLNCRFSRLYVNQNYCGELNAPIDIHRGEAIPGSYALYPNYPNPFNSSTVLSYDLPNAEFVRLDIVNAKGQNIRTLVRENQTAGYHQVIWDGANQTGNPVPTGIYFYILHAGQPLQVGKMEVIR